jgi:hypothetical protein
MHHIIEQFLKLGYITDNPIVMNLTDKNTTQKQDFLSNTINTLTTADYMLDGTYLITFAQLELALPKEEENNSSRKTASNNLYPTLDFGFEGYGKNDLESGNPVIARFFRINFKDDDDQGQFRFNVHILAYRIKDTYANFMHKSVERRATIEPALQPLR